MIQKIYALLESKKFIISVMITNGVILCFLVVLLIFMRKGDVQGGMSDADTVSQVSEYSDKDADLANIYVALLEGNDFTFDDGKHFIFGSDSGYSGYFNPDNPNVKDFHYQVVPEGNMIKLMLHNKEGTHSISYEMTFDKKGNIVLQDSGDKQQIVLRF